MKNTQSLQRSILASLSYFDVFDYPLKVDELWRWLYVLEPPDRKEILGVSADDIDRALSSVEMQSFTERVGQYIVLRGRRQVIALREQRYRDNQRKWQRAFLAAKVIRFLPFVQFVAVVNTLAIDNARPESDIDFLIVVRQGRMWLTRFLVTVAVQALGIRRHGLRIADRICLSFYMSDSNLNLKPLRLSGQTDTYLTYWATQIVPLFDRGGLYRRFVNDNLWLTQRLPHGFQMDRAPTFSASRIVRLVRSVPEHLLSGQFGQVIESFLRSLQVRWMQRVRDEQRLRRKTDVLINDHILKFHERDRRHEYRQAFNARLATWRRNA